MRVTAATAPTRHISLDALRGFAVMAILWANIPEMGLPTIAYTDPAIGTTGSTSDIAAWIFTFIFFDGKMRAIFAMIFGASMMLIIERAEYSGQSPAHVHYWRMFWLAIFGLCHFYLLWWGDILFAYAGSGAAVFFLRGWSGKTLILSGIFAYVIVTLFTISGMAGMLSLQAEAMRPGASGDVINEYSQLIQNSGISPQWLAKETALYDEGSYLQILIHKLTNEGLRPFLGLIYSLQEYIPLMMIGMGLYKTGFVLGHRDRRLYIHLGIWGTIIGGLCCAALAWLSLAQDFNIIWMVNIMAWSSLPRLVMALGYVALSVLLFRRYASHPLTLRIAAAGRVAFSNYLGSSLVMTFVFYGWGLGLFGSIGRMPMIIFALVGWAFMLLWSQAWLIRFRYGPLEWLWRSLARGSWQPMLIDK